MKELYYYLDATPTHSYLKMLYKYPQREYPYARVIDENRRPGKEQPEFELLDTGIFDATATSTCSSSMRRLNRTTF